MFLVGRLDPNTGEDENIWLALDALHKVCANSLIRQRNDVDVDECMKVFSNPHVEREWSGRWVAALLGTALNQSKTGCHRKTEEIEQLKARVSILEKQNANLKRDLSSFRRREIARNPTSSSEALKCPIMGKLFRDPVRSKVCGHIYSRQGIEQLLRQSGHRASVRCPVAGCSNSALTSAQLEEDHEAAMKVRRQKRREANEREQRMTQAIYEDSDEEEM
jgi:hypothetical protein